MAVVNEAYRSLEIFGADKTTLFYKLVADNEALKFRKKDALKKVVQGPSCRICGYNTDKSIKVKFKNLDPFYKAKAFQSIQSS